MKKSKLEQKTPLKQGKGLHPISDKQREINKLWNEVTVERRMDEEFICQWCHKWGHSGDREDLLYLDGHHILRRRFGNHTKGNCFIVHRKCHPMADRYVREYK